MNIDEASAADQAARKRMTRDETWLGQCVSRTYTEWHDMVLGLRAGGMTEAADRLDADVTASARAFGYLPTEQTEQTDVKTYYDAPEYQEAPNGMKFIDQQVIVNDGENLDDVARELIGPKGKAVYRVLGYVEPADQWPTIRFTGTTHELAAIAAKASGVPVGRPRNR